jgi:formate dehydrogenase maturation protein FdhE
MWGMAGSMNDSLKTSRICPWEGSMAVSGIAREVHRENDPRYDCQTCSLCLWNTLRPGSPNPRLGSGM